jgi:hypothetical protein
MNRFSVFLMGLAGLLGCNSAPVESNDLPDEDVAEVQEALGSCNRPTGDAGDQTAPFASYVTSVHVNTLGSSLIPWQLKVGSTDVATGVTTYAVIDFGFWQARFSGPGWNGTRLDHVSKYNPTDLPCVHTGDPNLKCIHMGGPGSWGGNGYLYADKRYAAPIFDGTAWLGDGVTKIRGYGRWTAQTLKFYYDNGGALGTSSVLFEGATLDECANPWTP